MVNVTGTPEYDVVDVGETEKAMSGDDDDETAPDPHELSTAAPRHIASTARERRAIGDKLNELLTASAIAIPLWVLVPAMRAPHVNATTRMLLTFRME